MKIAAIYFGQPRFVNNPNCFSSQNEKIFSQGDVDVFAHIWESDKDYEFSTWSGMNNCPGNKKDVEVFIEKWKPLKCEVEQNRQFSNVPLFEKFLKRGKVPGRDLKSALHNFNLMLSQVYSIEKAIDLYESYIKENNVSYDFVIFLRSDLCIWDFPILKDLEKEYFYFSSIFSFEHFADLCYITSPKFVSGLKCYSYLTKESSDIVEKANLANAETIKKTTFLSKHSIKNLRQVLLPVRVVRDLTGTGPQW